MKNNAVILIVVSALVFGAGGFFGGMKYAQGKRVQFTNGQFGGSAMQGGRFAGQNGTNGRGGFRPVSGEIIRADETSITVKLPDGGSKIILISGKTSINKTEEGSTADLKTGERVSVFGTENSDGSVTAQNVQIGGLMRFQVSTTPTVSPAK